MRLINADVVEQKIRNAWINDIIGYSEVNILKDLLKGESIIEAEPVRKGKWIWYYRPGNYYCSECGFCADGYTRECIDGIFKFCPKCGVKIESVEDEELL